MEKRTWCYVGEPRSYGIPGCKCGNGNCVYSEFKDRLWCDKCQIDFEPEHWGVFVGPVMFEMSNLLGMNFDKIDLINDKYIMVDGTVGEDGLLIEKILETQEEIDERIRTFREKSDTFLANAGLELDGDKIKIVGR